MPTVSPVVLQPWNVVILFIRSVSSLPLPSYPTLSSAALFLSLAHFLYAPFVSFIPLFRGSLNLPKVMQFGAGLTDVLRGTRSADRSVGQPCPAPVLADWTKAARGSVRTESGYLGNEAIERCMRAGGGGGRLAGWVGSLRQVVGDQRPYLSPVASASRGRLAHCRSHADDESSSVISIRINHRVYRENDTDEDND